MKIKVAIVSATFVLCMLGNAQAQWAYYNNDCPRLSVEASAVLLDRQGDDNHIPLVFNDQTLAPLLTSTQATDLNTAQGSKCR